MDGNGFAVATTLWSLQRTSAQQPQRVRVQFPDTNGDEIARLFVLFGRGCDQKAFMEDWTAKYVNYSPMMRFHLHDEDERSFPVERWCFRGSVNRWISLRGPAPIPEQINQYARHLGHESSFDLT